MNQSLEPRLRHLEDIDAIRRLKAQYCLYADDPDKATEFASLFTEHAVLDEGEDFMIIRGREQILQMHRALWPYLRLNQHFAFSPVIEVDGDTATGHWRLLQLTTIAEADSEERAVWSCGWYDEKYVRVDADWKIEHVIARVHFSCPYEDGWAKTPFGPFLSEESIASVLERIQEESK